MSNATLSRACVEYIGLLRQHQSEQPLVLQPNRPQFQRQRRRLGKLALEVGCRIKLQTSLDFDVIGLRAGFKVREEPVQTPHRPKTPEKDDSV
ncbi:hypothetical protein [Alicyclobacillus sp. SO9]|uniref:hypothetical protein n=1 Tax=Alicyclobacillus sp. SO9 TaxID=2665646 RepID=UPI0018E8BAF7|nr:hypothetical protein [Alicyclobacillus sp. SO9]QQE79261.1 hypothetical protein GI364_01760 [Alicyclobacillus sp. SO9]